MHKVWAVIRREFVERVRTRTFLLSTLLFPALMIGITVLPVLLDRRVQAPRRIVVLDGASGEAGTRVTDGLAAAKRTAQAAKIVNGSLMPSVWRRARRSGKSVRFRMRRSAQGRTLTAAVPS